ncbi:cytochrome P450 [Entophlyctis helioformis]|nr:cytochrome P450 [Entophlyctis helioformis]
MAILSTLNSLADSLQRQSQLSLAVAAAVAAVPLLYWLAAALTPTPPAAIPRPPGWPILGNFLEFAPYAKGRAFKYFDILAKKYGDLAAFSMLGEYRVVVSDPDLIKRILTTPDEFGRPAFRDVAASGVLDHALFMLPTNDQWKRHRKLLQPAFGPSHLRQTITATADVVNTVAADLRVLIKASTSPNGITIDFHEYMAALTLDVIGKIGFSKNLESVSKLGTSDQAMAQKNLSATMAIAQNRLYTPHFLWKRNGIASDSPEVASVRSYTKKLVRDVIAERRAAMISGGHAERGKWDMDVLDRLLLNCDDPSVSPENRMTEDEVIGETLGFFVAGHETSANTLTHLILVLCEHPDVMAKLVADIDRVYASIDGKITIENLFQFKYLDWVIKESMRYYPTAPLLSRTSVKPVTLNGVTFPAGVNFSLRLNGTMKDPRFWKDPESFIPERWNDFTPVPNTYNPFGDGGHVCIGQKMANVEVRVAAIHLLRNFSFKLVEGQTFEFVTYITSSLKNGLFVAVTERAH